MTDLPRSDFTPLPPPPGGSAAARRLGQRRQRRRLTAVTAGALAVSGVALSVVVTTGASSAIDRLEPAPFATGVPELPELPDAPLPTRAPTLPSALPRLPATSGSTTPRPQPTHTPVGEQPRPGSTSDVQEPDPGTRSAVLVRSYDPPTGNDATVCGGRVSSGIGAPNAQTGWCVMASVQERPGRAPHLAVRVCRSSEASKATLHVEEGAALLRLEQDGQVVWRMPASGEPAVELPIEPAGCWIWTHDWDGRDDQGEPLQAGPTVLLVESLAAEVDGFTDQDEFNHSG